MVLQPTFSDSLFHDLLSHFQDFGASAVVDVGGCQVVQTLVSTVVVVAINEGADLTFQVTRQEVVFRENTVFHGLMPTPDLALGLRVVRRAADVIHALVLEIIRRVSRNV